MDGVYKDGRKWKIDYATKVRTGRAAQHPCGSLSNFQQLLTGRWRACVDQLRRPQADFKFFGWKVPEEVVSPSRSPSRSPVRSEYSD